MGISLVPSTPHEGMTLISTTTLSGASVALTSIPQIYNSLYLIIRNYLPSADNAWMQIRFNNIATTTYVDGNAFTATSTTRTKASNDTLTNGMQFLRSDNSVVQSLGWVQIPDYTNTTTNKIAWLSGISNDDAAPTTTWRFVGGMGTSTATTAITELNFFPSSGNFTSGTILLYGVN